MTEEIFRIADLIVKQLRGNLGEQERIILENWLSNAENRELLEKLSNEKELNDRVARLHDIDSEAARKKAYEQLFPGVIPMGERKKAGWQRMMVAASLLMVVTLGILFATGIFTNKQQSASTEIFKPATQHDVDPANGDVVLVLANGNRVMLDSAGQGSLLQQGDASVVKGDGGISYEVKKPGGELVYNTLQTNKGKQYTLTLADGSRVWLNAETSVYYPTTFNGKERRVTIQGEAYFEITKDTGMPFIVETGNMEVEVLGTHFNIMAYNNEPGKKTTLIEGSVQIRDGNKSVKLEPGAQAIVAENKEIAIIENADTEEALAWKNGTFQFQRASMDAILRQVQRWYDVQVVYDGSIKNGFNGGIPRDVPLSKLLYMLELTGWVKFKLENNILTVIPGN